MTEEGAVVSVLEVSPEERIPQILISCEASTPGLQISMRDEMKLEMHCG